jgi:hypothetical protein
MNWLNGSKYNMFLSPVKLPSGKVVLSFMGDVKQNSKELESLKFKPFAIEGETLFYVCTAYTGANGGLKGFNPQIFIDALPDLYIEDMTSEDIRNPALNFVKTYIAKKKSEKLAEQENLAQKDKDDPSISAEEKEAADKAKAKALADKTAKEELDFEQSIKKSLKRASVQLAQATVLGVNLQGETVFEDMDTRYIKTVSGDALRASDAYDEEPRFLKAGKASSLSPISVAESLRGYTQELVKGEEMSFEQLKRACKIIFSDYDDFIQKDPNGLFKLHIIAQRAIEINLLDPIRSECLSNNKDEKLVTKTSDLFIRRPVVPESDYPEGFVYDRGITPVVSLIAGEFLADVKGQVIIPNAVNGLITANLPENGNVIASVEKGTMHMGVMRSSHFNDHVTQLNEISLAEQSYAANSADGMIIAMRSGTLDKPVMQDGLSITQRDQYETMRSLHALTENGKAIVVIGGDGNGSLGEISSKSEDFHQWLYTYYKVNSVIDVDSGLYGKSGDDKSSRVYALDGKRIVPSNDIAPKEIEKAISPLQLWSWRENLVGDITQEKDKVDSLSAGTILNSEEIVINAFQSKYIAMFPAGDVDAMVPKNLSNPLRIGFSKFLKDHDDPVAFLTDKLKMDTVELREVFNAEQLDALCLAIWNYEKGEGFINGDMGGKGKGRFLAGMMRYGIINNHTPVFMTNKSPLFHDIYRDMKDIRSEHLLRPFVMNGSAATIKDENNNVIHKTDSKAVKEHIEKGTFPDANIYFCTYSQISRVPLPTTYVADDGTQTTIDKNKAHWLANAAQGGLLLADESHEMSGASNTNVNFTHITSKMSGVSFASATWSRTPDNIAAYRSLFPSYITSEDIKAAIKKGKEPVQEIISATLASDGKYVCREHDMSLIKADTIVNEDDRERNIDYSNKLANFLQAWAVLTNEISDFIDTNNKQLISKMKNAGTYNSSRHKNIGLNNVGFGSRITHIIDQFMLTINTGEAIKNARDALKNENQKPLISLEHTGGTLLKSIFEEKRDELVAAGADQKTVNKTGIPLDEMPSFADLLKHAVKNSLYATKTTVSSKKRVSVRQLINSKKRQGKMDDALESINEVIDGFKDLPFSPLDEIIAKLESQGVSVGEVSGRQFRVVKEDEHYRLVKSKNRDVKTVISEFNNGDTDCLLFTRSGSNGHSMHSSEKFLDQRQRKMFILENPASPINALQVRWRINRTGQVHLPKYGVLSTGLALGNRKNSLDNRGVRQVSSNTNSNRRNVNENTDVFDIISPIGDMAFQRYLSARPDLLKKLNMTVADIGKDDSSLEKNSIESLALKTTGRLAMLTYDEQLRVHEEVTSQAKAISTSLDSQGINIVNPTNLDLKAREISRSVYMGTAKTYYDSEFDRPIELVHLEYEYTPKIINGEDLTLLIERGKGELASDMRMDSYGDDLSPLAELLEKNKDDLLSEWIPTGSQMTLAELMAQPAQGYLVNRENAKMKFMIGMLEELGPGSIIYDKYKRKEWVVSRVDLPFKGSENNPGLYQVTMHTNSGHFRRQELSLDEMFIVNDGQFDLSPEKFHANHHLSAAFDAQSSEPETMQIMSLEGNLFEAVIMAGNERLGMPATYTDHKGATKRGILIAENISEFELLQRPVPFRKEMEAADYIRTHPNSMLASSNEIKSSTDVYIRANRDKTNFKLYVPNNINKGSKYWNDPMLKAILNGREFEDKQGSKTIDVYDDELNPLVCHLMKNGCKFVCEAGKLNWIQDYHKGKVTDIPAYNTSKSTAANSSSPQPF